jgi:hypothetical protein
MSKRMTLAEDDTTEVVVSPPLAPFEAPPPASLASPASPGLAEKPEPVQSAGAVSRKVLREERRERQRVAAICALVVALCMGMTVLILTIARDRPAGSIPVGSGVVVTHQISSIQALPRPGA